MKKNIILAFIIISLLFNFNTVNALTIDYSDMRELLKNSIQNVDEVLDSDMYLGPDWYNDEGYMLPVLGLDTKYIKTTIMYENDGRAVVENYNLISEEEYNDIEPQSWCGSGETCWETNAKKLTVAVLGDGIPNIKYAVINVWKTLPKVRSFDNIGIIYFTRSLDFSTAYGYQYYNTQTTPNHRDNVYYEYNGSNMKINMSINANESGISISQNLVNNAYTILQNELWVRGSISSSSVGDMILASYQHAVQDIDLTTAKNFNFSGSGMGRVFAWNTSYSKWDNMQGVCLKNGGNILWNC